MMTPERRKAIVAFIATHAALHENDLSVPIELLAEVDRLTAEVARLTAELAKAEASLEWI
jgi:uncharacterized small protein (DUF1192 family)